MYNIYCVYQGIYIMCVCVCVCVGGQVEVRLSIRPSSSTGVLFALVSNHSAPLSVAVVRQGEHEAVRIHHCLHPHPLHPPR